MIRRNTWILLGAFSVALGAYLVWNASRPEAQAPEVTPAPMPLWSVPSEDIVTLIVEDFESGELLELSRDQDALWQQISPNPGEADAARVERAVSWLASPSPRAEVLESTELSAFQLDRPRYRVEIVLEDGSRLSFQVGRESPTGGSTYLLVPGRVGVVVVSNAGLDEVLTLGLDLQMAASPEVQVTEAEPAAVQTEEPPEEDY